MNHMEYKLKASLNSNFSPVKFRIKGKPHYQMFLEIYSEEDPELEKVGFVEYRLHPSFKERTRVSTLRKNNFRIEIKAWGTFEVEITIGTTDGSQIRFREDIKNVLERVPM